MKQGALKEQRYNSRAGLQFYNEQGFIPSDISLRGTCLTVEYSFDDWAISTMAGALGYLEDQILFKNKSLNYKNHFDSVEKFFCPLDRNKKFNCPLFKLNIFDERYIEGDAWHYRFFAPHDAEGLIQLLGKEYFVSELNDFFIKSRNFPWNVLPNPYYWSGNEHDLFSVWYFNWANRSDLTQLHSRWILENKYSIYSDGLSGNDDYGTLSAWFILGSIGFFSIIRKFKIYCRKSFI